METFSRNEDIWGFRILLLLNKGKIKCTDRVYTEKEKEKMRCVLACESDATKSTAQICTISKHFATYVGSVYCSASGFNRI